MKSIAFLLLCTVYLFGFDYKLEPKKVSDDVWCFFGALEMPTNNNGGNMSNSCYIKTNSSYILIDSGATHEFAKQSYEAMSKIEKLPVSTVINTHGHDDHWLGNSFYKDTFNAKIYGTNEMNKGVDIGQNNRMYHLISKDLLNGTKFVKADIVINQVTTLKIDNKELVIIPIGVKAHSSEDLFIYMPKEKVLFSGDVIMNGRITSNRDGSVIGQLKAIDMVNEKDWSVLVPGHGFDTSKNATNEMKEYFTLLKQRVLKAVEDDVGANNVTSTVKMEEFKNKAMYDELNSNNVFDAYRELEFYDGE